MNPGFGYLRDEPHKRTQKDARNILKALAPELPPSSSLERFEAEIMDQGATGSCTGHGTAQLLTVAFASKGEPLPFVPSALGPYQIARCVARGEAADHGGSVDAPLADSGAMPADVMAGITLWGIRPMGPRPSDGRFSDVTPANVNDEPELGDLEADAEALVVGEYRIDEASGDVVDQIRRALVAGYPVGIGAFVDSSFVGWSPGSPLPSSPNVSDPNGGGHWFVITSYRTAPDGSLVFRGPNSWGSGWGDGGHWEASEAFIRAAWDLYVFNVRKVKLT
jgi:hypothetical protein